MNPSQFWQNFKLGQEQEIAAGFVYDGLKAFHSLDVLSSEIELFPVLYNISIGIERLIKVGIILAEFSDGSNVARFEKSFKTHELGVLWARINKIEGFPLSPVHLELIQLLSVFYNQHRYDRLSFKSFTVFSKDVKAFLVFLNKHLDTDITEDPPLLYVRNSNEIKVFLGRIVKDITKGLYNFIQLYASKKNLFTDELSSAYSKSAKVLLGDEPITFNREDQVVLETLIFLNKCGDSGLMGALGTIEPLDLDLALAAEYLKAILHRRPQELQGIVDEIDAIYDEMADDQRQDRLGLINAIIEGEGFE